MNSLPNVLESFNLNTFYNSKENDRNKFDE